MNTPNETDAARKSRVVLAHRKALQDLARMTLRYQVHNELATARHAASRAIVLVGALVLGAVPS